MKIPALTSPFKLKPMFAGLALAPALIITAPAPVSAQDNLSEARLRKIEAEIRALQRNVFPGGDERFFEPQIRPDQTEQPSQRTGPSTTAVTDILARLDAMEVQLQRLTGITEENANAVRLLTARVAEVETQNAELLAAREAAAQPEEPLEDAAQDGARIVDSNLAAMGAGEPGEEPAQSDSALPALVPSEANAPEATTSTPGSNDTGPTPERLAAVQAIAKPQTDDPAGR